MDYGRFQRLRQPIWEDLERRLQAAERQPPDHDGLEALALGYRQVLQDQALAGSRFPGTAVARRLKTLSLRAHRWLHQETQLTARGLVARFVRFWVRTFPLTFRQYLPLFTLSLGLLLLGTLMGLLLTTVRMEVAYVFLAPEVVAALKEQRIWTDSLREAPSPVIGSMIAANNIKVALFGWVGGALAGIGSTYVLLLNGFLLGSVLSITMRFSMEHRLLDFISAHGPLELTLIVVTAGTGLAVGRALIAAGDEPRGEALRKAGWDAFLLFLGTVPWFLLLGLVESFLSPSPDLTSGLKVAIGAALLTAFLIVAWNPFLRGVSTRSGELHG
jgi:uncharacterized membrane protein SpoIIM required for sporulation